MMRVLVFLALFSVAVEAQYAVCGEDYSNWGSINETVIAANYTVMCAWNSTCIDTIATTTGMNMSLYQLDNLCPMYAACGYDFDAESATHTELMDAMCDGAAVSACGAATNTMSDEPITAEMCAMIDACPANFDPDSANHTELVAAICDGAAANACGAAMEPIFLGVNEMCAMVDACGADFDPDNATHTELMAAVCTDGTMSACGDALVAVSVAMNDTEGMEMSDEVCAMVGICGADFDPDTATPAEMMAAVCTDATMSACGDAMVAVSVAMNDTEDLEMMSNETCAAMAGLSACGSDFDVFAEDAEETDVSAFCTDGAMNDCGLAVKAIAEAEDPTSAALMTDQMCAAIEEDTSTDDEEDTPAGSEELGTSDGRVSKPEMVAMAAFAAVAGASWQ